MKAKTTKKPKLAILLALALLLLFSLPTAAAAAGPGGDYAGHFLANYVTRLYNAEIGNFPGDGANAVLQTADGFLWFGGYSGLYRYDGARYTVWDALTPGGFGSSNIRALYEDSAGVLWIGTNDRGLVSYQNGTFNVYDKAMGAASNTVRSICEGPGGQIFAAGPEGIFSVDRDGAVELVPLDTETPPYVISLACDEWGNLFAVTNGGDLYVLTPDALTSRYPYEGAVYSVGSISGNRVAAGTRGGDVLILRFGVTAFAESQVITTPLVNIDAVYEDSRAYIWLAAEDGIGFLDGNGRYQHVGNPSGAGFYSGIVEDYQNNFWISATVGGIVNFARSAFTDVFALMDIAGGAANAVLLHDGITYIGTNDGLMIVDGQGRHIHAPFTETVGQTRVRGIFADSLGHVWICTYSELGVIRFSPDTGAYSSWTAADGLVSDRTRLIQELPNGIIAVGTAEGISFIEGDDVVGVERAFNSDTFIELPDIMVLSFALTADSTLYAGTDGGGVHAIRADGSRRYQEEDGLTGGVILRMLPATDGGVWVGASPGLCHIGTDGTVTVVEQVPPLTFLDIMRQGDDLVLLTSQAVIRTNEAALLDADGPFEHGIWDRNDGLRSTIAANAWNAITADGELYFCTDGGVKMLRLEAGLQSFIPHAAVAKISVDDVEYGDFSTPIIIPHDAERLTAYLSHLTYGFLDDSLLFYQLLGQDSEARALMRGEAHDISYTNLAGGEYVLRVWTENPAGAIGSLVEINMRKELGYFERFYVWIGLGLIFVLTMVFIVGGIFRAKHQKLHERQRELRSTISQSLTALVNAIDAKDAYTSGHSARVAAYSVAIARRMGKDAEFIENLYYIGLLHDVGKIGIAGSIINKPGKLSDVEFEEIKNHPSIGKHILKDISTIPNLGAGASEHHERWDGRGYVQGLSGEGISLEARIIAVADAYDAMSSDRPYREAMGKEEILAELRRCRATQFDPEIADVMIELVEGEFV